MRDCLGDKACSSWLGPGGWDHKPGRGCGTAERLAPLPSAAPSIIMLYLCWAAIRESLVNHHVRREPQMKRLVLAAAISLTFLPAAGLAEGRGGHAPFGAPSGPVVFGAVRAAAGAVVGYTAGPSLAHSCGFSRSRFPRPAPAE